MVPDTYVVPRQADNAGQGAEAHRAARGERGRPERLPQHRAPREASKSKLAKAVVQKKAGSVANRGCAGSGRSGLPGHFRDRSGPRLGGLRPRHRIGRRAAGPTPRSMAVITTSRTSDTGRPAAQDSSSSAYPAARRTSGSPDGRRAWRALYFWKQRDLGASPSPRRKGRNQASPSPSLARASSSEYTPHGRSSRPSRELGPRREGAGPGDGPHHCSAFADDPQARPRRRRPGGGDLPDRITAGRSRARKSGPASPRLRRRAVRVALDCPRAGVAKTMLYSWLNV